MMKVITLYSRHLKFIITTVLTILNNTFLLQGQKISKYEYYKPTDLSSFINCKG